MTDPVHPEIGYLLTLAADSVGRRWAADLERIGLNPRQHGVLATLDRRPGISSGELARAVMVTPQAMTDVVRTLERRGLLTRLAPPRRGEPSSLEVSAAGRELLQRAAPILAAHNAPQAYGLDAGEASVFAAMLSRVVEASGSQR